MKRTVKGILIKKKQLKDSIYFTPNMTYDTTLFDNQFDLPSSTTSSPSQQLLPPPWPRFRLQIHPRTDMVV